jgi:hypothetical protein
MDVGDSTNTWPALAAFPRSRGEAHAFWGDVVRLVELDEEPLLDALDDLINSDIIGPETVPLDVLAVVFITVWSTVLARRPQFVRSLRLPFESLEHRAEREDSMQMLGPVRRLCPYLEEVIADDLHWSFHPIPGEQCDPS